MTKKRYELDCYETRFQAKILECYEEDGKWKVILDQTCFYPEGGGQPADHGILDTAIVLDVHEKDGCIIHTVDSALEAVSYTHLDVYKRQAKGSGKRGVCSNR